MYIGNNVCGYYCVAYEETQANRVSNFRKNLTSLKPALKGICSLADYSVAYKETQSNRVSDFRDFVCSLFSKAILFDFYSSTLLFPAQIVLFRKRAILSKEIFFPK